MTTLIISIVSILQCLSVQSIIIDTKLGKIEGTTNENSVHRFLSIPYAEPPVGNLRWKPTVPLKRSILNNNVFNARDWGNVCIHPTFGMAMSNDTQPEFTEDCLYLNVYTKYNFSDNNDDLKPVLFWIHGGGLMLGTAMTSIYEASSVVNEQDIVVVAINYRLGVAAWLIDENGEGGANGILDMITALKWVQSNIESFGGNPNQVTIAGESGGGWAVCGLVLSPLANGLFKRSIQMSGSCIESAGKFRTKNQAMKQTKQYIMAPLNVSSIDELRKLDMQIIADTLDVSDQYIPSIDGYVFPISTLDLIKTGHVNGESVMIGNLLRESFTAEPFKMGYEAQNETDLNEWYSTYFHDYQVKQINKYYPFDKLKQKIWRYGDSIFDNGRETVLLQSVLQTDCWVRCGSIKQTQILTDKNSAITRNRIPVYYYQFGYINEPFDKTYHGYDIGPLFGHNFTLFGEEMDDAGLKFGKIARQFFVDYIKGNVPAKTECGKEATVQNGKYIEILDEIRVVDISDLDVNKERCKLFDNVLKDDAFENAQFCFGLKSEWSVEDAEDGLAEMVGFDDGSDAKEVEKSKQDL